MTIGKPGTAMRLILIGALLATTSACTVGPNYGGAPHSAPAASQRGAFLRGGGATTPAATVASWWTTLNDPVLDGLITHGLANSPGVAAANARIAQARAGLAANKTAALPTLGASVTTPYINIPADLLSQNGSGGRTDIQRYSLGFDASWELDLFGSTRRKVEAASARAEAAEAGLADSQVSLSSEIARVYVGLRARQAMLATLQQQAAIDRNLVSLADQRYHRGTAPLQPVHQAHAQAAQTDGQIASTRAEIVVLADQLAVLTGQEPGALDTLIEAVRPIPAPPALVAVGDPSLLLRNRPDIRIAERQLAAANADVGASMADRFPKISFLGMLGLGGNSVGDIFDTGSLIGLALPRLTWTLFDGGRGAAKVEQTKGAKAEAEANYRARVLGALGDAENALTRFGSDRIELGKALEAESSGARTADLQQQRYSAGTTSRTDALNAQRQRLQLAMAALNARAELTSDYIAVMKALGLGWQPAATGQ